MRRRGRFDAAEDTPDGGTAVTAQEAAVAADDNTEPATASADTTTAVEASADDSLLGRIGSRLGAVIETLLPERRRRRRRDADAEAPALPDETVLAQCVDHLDTGLSAFLAADVNSRYIGVRANLEKTIVLLDYVDENYFYATLKANSAVPAGWIAVDLLTSAWALVVYVVHATRSKTRKPLEEMPDDAANAMTKYITRACRDVDQRCGAVVSLMRTGEYRLVDGETPLTLEERRILDQMADWKTCPMTPADGDAGSPADEDGGELTVVS